MQIFIIIYGICFGLLMAASYRKKSRKYYLIIKSITSFIFVLMAYITMKDQMEWIWMIAFIFCFLGDVLLGMVEKKEDSSMFVLGLASFVSGHLFFIIQMSRITQFELIDLLLPMVMCFVASKLIQLPKFHIGNHKRPILVYSIIITLLCVKGVDMAFFDLSYKWLMVGCFSFLISDFILLFLYFYEDKHKLLKFFNLFTYYFAVLLLSMTTF